jgi:multimeric flavodoxin WrbA
MTNKANRRVVLEALAAATLLAAAAPLAGGEAEAALKTVKIIGINCSPRKGKSTAAAVQIALDAAKQTAPNIEVELIELSGVRMDPAAPTALDDDFAKLAPMLSDPKVGGIIIGTPVYFGNMSALCKTFLERWMLFRKNNFALANKVGGVVAVGGARNGGQELCLQSVQAAMLCQEMVVVGDGRPTAHMGATLVNPGNDDIAGDEFGVATAKNLGRRVAEVALKLAK